MKSVSASLRLRSKSFYDRLSSSPPLPRSNLIYIWSGASFPIFLWEGGKILSLDIVYTGFSSFLKGTIFLTYFQKNLFNVLIYLHAITNVLVNQIKLSTDNKKTNNDKIRWNCRILLSLNDEAPELGPDCTIVFFFLFSSDLSLKWGHQSASLEKVFFFSIFW